MIYIITEYEYEQGDWILFAFKSKTDAENKLKELKASSNHTWIKGYELTEIELI